MKKTMLILGVSKGIGKACFDRFNNEYEVLTVSKTKGNFVGDIEDSEFRQNILQQVDPDIVLNCFGTEGTKGFLKTMQINYLAAGELTFSFQKKMKPGGLIINLLSTASELTYRGMSDADLIYNSSKGALAHFTKLLQGSLQNKVRITNLELGFVNTDFANIKKRAEAKADVFGRREMIPMEPSYVTDVINWIIQQPDSVCINKLKIGNT